MAFRTVKMAALAIDLHHLLLALASVVMKETNVKVSIMYVNVNIRDWSLIMRSGGGRATKWENYGFETFCTHSPSRQSKAFCAQLFIDWKPFVNPLHYG